MKLAPVPQESKKQVNRAGQILASGSSDSNELAWALSLADKWRACHAYPINTFQSTLRRKLKDYPKEPIAAQRLKRMPTIIDKLRRYPSMQLTTMQDIGGVRAVLASVADAQSLATYYRNNKRFAHEHTNEYDYIQEPRDADGYRSIHLIYKYKNVLEPNYDGLRL